LEPHEQAADKLGGNDFGGAGEEGVGEDWEDLGGYWGRAETVGGMLAYAQIP